MKRDNKKIDTAQRITECIWLRYAPPKFLASLGASDTLGTLGDIPNPCLLRRYEDEK